jgi:hypothetical protein
VLGVLAVRESTKITLRYYYELGKWRLANFLNWVARLI